MFRHESPVHEVVHLNQERKSVHDSDIALMMREGAPEGARWLLQKYGGQVKAGLRCEFRHILADPEIDEALNTGALKTFRAARQYDESRGSLRGWFYKIARNAARDILRGEQRHQAVPLEFDPPSHVEVEAQEDEHGPPEHNKLSHDLKEAVAALPPLQRAIIEADLASGGTADAKRLAQAHGTTVNTIYVSRSHAMRKLREEMQRRGYQTPRRHNGGAHNEQ